MAIDSGLVRVQPVPPEHRPWTDLFGDALGELLVGFTQALLLMIGFGAAHSLWPNVPAAGYWACFGLVLGISVLHRRTHKWWSR